MKITAQVYTKKGFYGEPQEFEIGLVSDLSAAIVKRLDRMPDEFEDEKLVDWTSISIEVTR